MPYLHRKPFIRHPPPPGLQLNERLFHCRLTNEGFRDYDEFFERTILCNSLVWSCSLSGKSGLTYSEALESEKKIRISLQNFPQPLILPVLYLSTLTVRHRVTDLCEDVFGYVKNRFFVGETVDVVRNSGARLECKVLEVKLPPQENGLANGYNNHDDDTIVISDSDDEPSNDPPQNGKKKEPVDPSLLKYKVKPIKKELYESVTVKSCQVSRKPALFSQERLKLFLKLHCEPQNGIIKLKARSHAKYEVSEKNFLRYFPDDPPLFQHSTVLRGQTGKSSKVSHRGGGLSNEKKSKSSREQERILKHKNELRAIELEKARIRREHVEIEKHRVRERQNKEREREEQKKFLEEERLKRKEEIERLRLEKEKEREKIREEKRKYAEHLKLWSKPREDMECDDLKELPTPTSVKTRVPPDCFGDAIMVLEFLHSFGDLFDLRDEFPEGMTFDMLEEALVGSNPEGPLCELLFFFLTAIFQAMTEEEEEVAKDQIIGAETKDLTEALDEVTDPTKSVLSAVASLAAAWPQLHQGCMLKDLDLDSCTLSEILRLHILSSGAEANSASAKYRYQKQGGFDATDDACVEFRLSHPALLKKLSSSSVYALEPGEKLKILHALCGQLLTLVSTRDYIEDYFEELRQSKQEYRELKSEQNRRGREGAAARIRKRKVHKLQEQELKMKDKHEKLKEEENASLTKGTGNDDFDTGSENKDALQNDPDSEAEDATTLGKKGNKIQNGLRDGKTSDPNAEGTLEKKEPLTPEEEEAVRQEQQKKEQELLKNIQEATSCTNIFPLGRDRWYRRFWTFSSVPGLFVEEDYYGLSEDMLEARPISHRDAINAALNGHESSVQETKEVSKPVTKPNRWWFYNSTEQLDQLIECLNTRGYRECSLRYTLMQEKGKISKKLAELPVSRFHVSDDTPPADAKPIRGRSQNMPDQVQTSGEKHLQIRLCDLLLDIEDRIYQGTLGTVKVPDRQTWRASIEKCCMETSSEETKENGVLKTASCDVEEMDVDSKHSILDRVQGLKNDTPSATSTSTNTPLPVNNTVRFLARALLQIEHGVERKFMKSPLGGADDIKKDKKSLKKKDEEQSTEKDDASDGGRTHRTVLDRWRESLSSSCSLSQIFLHLSTLDHSILWSRSILNARCRVCRKKGDSESMLLCDGCDRGHHIYCVRPKLKYVPEEDWFCPECRPKQRSRRPPARQRPSVDSDEEMEEVEEEEESDHSESENEEEEQSDESYEESPPKRGKAKVRFPLKKGGKAAGKPGPKKKGKISRSLQGTPKNNMSAPRGRGRGTGRKVHSAPPLVSKTSTRVSARKAQGITMSSGTSPLEQGSLSGKGLGRGRGGGRGRGRMQKSADNTPVGSPFTLRPFSLDSPEATGRRGRGQSKNSMTVQLNSTGQSKKRLSTDISGDKINRRSSGRHQGVHELSACEQLVVELVRHEDSWPFMKLVSKIQVPDYFDIIQKPIALNLIREKVNKCDYKSASEFVEDVQLMFSNCFEYNHFNSNEARAGVRLQSFFTNEAEKLGLEVSRSNSHHSRPPAKRSRI